MSSINIVIPRDFAQFTIAREGSAGCCWLETLPALIETLCKRWRLTLEGDVVHGGMALILPARRENEPAILKISWIDESTKDEAAALLAWGGQGAVRLFEYGPALGAMLLERLNNRSSLSTIEITPAITIAGHLLRRLAIPPPTSLFPSLQTTATTFVHTFIQRWEHSDYPTPRHVLDQARSLAKQLSASPENHLLVDYDLHYANILASQREPWLAIDPKVIIGDPEFGIAQLLWCRLEDIQAHRGLKYHFQALTEAAALNYARARSWTFVRCVDYWLWSVSVGLTTDPARCQTIIDWLLRENHAS